MQTKYLHPYDHFFLEEDFFQLNQRYLVFPNVYFQVQRIGVCVINIICIKSIKSVNEIVHNSFTI